MFLGNKRRTPYNLKKNKNSCLFFTQFFCYFFYGFCGFSIAAEINNILKMFFTSSNDTYVTIFKYICYCIGWNVKEKYRNSI